MGTRDVDIADEDIAKEVIRRNADEWITEQYLTFALYAIHDRALVASDGLKPVNRRILWAMYVHGLVPSHRHIKAGIVGGMVEAYHPHGDASINDAQARLAQTFSMRVPLVDAYGNVGYVTGDRAAAPRYWESRLTPAAVELLKETSEDAVDMMKNYDGTRDEPVVLPSRFPNDLINGTDGMAVGYASKIPSHNPGEVMDTVIAMIKNPNMGVDELMSIMPGPDMPTGGEIVGTDGIKQYYETGHGKFLMRGRYRIEDRARGCKRIIFYELPYKVSAEKVMEKVKELRRDQERTVRGRKVTIPANSVLLHGISSMADLTDHQSNGIKLVVDTTRGTNPLSVIQELYATTGLEEWFAVNNTVLVDNHPRQVSVLEMIKNFIAFRYTCTARKLKHRISTVDGHLSHLNAILAVLADIDQCIAIIRSSSNQKAAHKALMSTFHISTDQADYILSMPLRRLTKSDRLEITRKAKDAEKQKKHINAVLSSRAKLRAYVIAELEDTKKVIDDPRRSLIRNMTVEDMSKDVAAMAEHIAQSAQDTPCVVSLLSDGTLYRAEDMFAYGPRTTKFTHGVVRGTASTSTRGSVLAVCADGMAHRIPVTYIPDKKTMTPHAMGLSFTSPIVGVVPDVGEKAGERAGIMMASASGMVKIAKIDTSSRHDFPLMGVDEGDTVVGCRYIPDMAETFIVMVSSSGHAIRFRTRDVRPSGGPAKGVKGMNLKKGATVIHATVIPEGSVGDSIIVTSSQRTVKATAMDEFPVKGRGGMGVATQGLKRGEDGIVTAWAGDHVTACDDDHKRVSLPEPTPRGNRGTDSPSIVTCGM